MRVAIFVVAVQAVVGLHLQDEFHTFNKEFNKLHASATEFELRRSIFMRNYNDMIEHNKRYEAGEESWWQKMTEDMDLTDEEWESKRLAGGLGAVPNNAEERIDVNHKTVQAKLAKLTANDDPKEFEWVSKGAVSSVKNQANCGSCAAFSVMASVESCYQILTGEMDDDLSEQHMLDCAYGHVYNDEYGSWSAHGCQGAWPVAYFDWLIKGKQNQEEVGYPYTHSGSLSHCKPKEDNYHTEAQVTGMQHTWHPEELEMVKLVQINPVSSAVQATRAWSSYGGGVFDDHSCCNQVSWPHTCRNKANHAILVAGYGHDEASGLDYWLIKNSWGSGWGDNGYIKLKKGTGHCAIGYVHQTIPVCEKN